MQCKDIPTQPILDFISKSDQWCTWYWADDFHPSNSVVRAMPEGVNDKLALAKMRKLIKQGLVDGCGCGCRGDFRLKDVKVGAT